MIPPLERLLKAVPSSLTALFYQRRGLVLLAIAAYNLVNKRDELGASMQWHRVECLLKNMDANEGLEDVDVDVWQIAPWREGLAQ